MAKKNAVQKKVDTKYLIDLAPIPSLKEFDSFVAMLEGGLSQANIGDVRQIRKQIFELIKKNADARRLLFAYLAKK